MKKLELQQIIKEEIQNILNKNYFKIGDKFEVTKSPDSKIMQYLKSAISIFYDRKIQPQTGDIYEVLPNEFKEFDSKLYTVKNINRPQEFIQALGPDTKEAVISMPKVWADVLYSKGYFTKIN